MSHLKEGVEPTLAVLYQICRRQWTQSERIFMYVFQMDQIRSPTNLPED